MKVSSNLEGSQKYDSQSQLVLQMINYIPEIKCTWYVLFPRWWWCRWCWWCVQERATKEAIKRKHNRNPFEALPQLNFYGLTDDEGMIGMESRWGWRRTPGYVQWIVMQSIIASKRGNSISLQWDIGKSNYFFLFFLCSISIAILVVRRIYVYPDWICFSTL